MIATASEIVSLIDTFAPWEKAEAWDNPGLLAGRGDAKVQRVLCALDLTRQVIHEAQQMDAQMVLTHHPILFHPRRNLREDDPEGALLCALVRSGLCHVAAHTNFDFARGGVNDALAIRLGISNISEMDNGGRIGEIQKAKFSEFADYVTWALGDTVRRYGDSDKEILRVAVMGGAGGEYAKDAAKCGADAYVTGEIHHHQALECCEMGMCVLEAGHGATESPAVPVLADSLREACQNAGFDTQINVSASALF